MGCSPAILAVRCACTLLALAAAAGAETIKVSTGLAAELQAAIDAAEPGDTISVSGGPYLGNFTIPEGKDGLTIKGKVVIDAQGGTNAFNVLSSGVTFSALTIRHAQQNGIIGTTVPITEITVSKCTFLDCGESAVVLFADDSQVESCVAEGCGGGFFLQGNRAIIAKSQVFSSVGLSILVQGNEAQVFKNVVTTGGNHGVVIGGNDASVTDNRVTNVAGDGVQVGGSDALIEGNTIQGAGAFCIQVIGSDCTASKNKVSFTTGAGVSASGEDVIVSHNTVEHVLADNPGILVTSIADTLVEGNEVESASGQGYLLTVTGAAITGNRALRCGLGGADAGFSVVGNDNVLAKNVAEDCADSGFSIEGSLNLLEDNVARGNGNNGFLMLALGSANNVLDDNLAKGNDGEGLQNGALATVLRDNTFKKNQLDLANETSAGATLVDDGGNVFETGGLTDEPVIDG